MGPLEKSRVVNYGRGTSYERQAYVARLQSEYEKSFRLSLEYRADALLNGVPQELIARPTKGDDRYQVSAHVGETFFEGDEVEAINHHWIIDDVDPDKDIYTHGYMHKCNLLMKFIVNGEIIERWAYVDVGSYAALLKDEFYLSTPNTDINVTMTLDDKTERLRVGSRFATNTIYDQDNKVMAVYRIIGFAPRTTECDGGHLLKFTCRSDAYNPSSDNLQLRVCDYYTAPDVTSNDVNCAILYNNDPVLRVGGTKKSFRVVFTDANGDRLGAEDVQWNVSCIDDTGLVIVSQDNDQITLKLNANVTIGTLYNLTVSSEVLGANASLTVKAVNMIG